MKIVDNSKIECESKLRKTRSDTKVLAKDGRSLKSKYNKGEISISEYRNELSKAKGFKDWGDYQNALAKEKGFKSSAERRSELAKKRGFEDFNDYNRKMRYKRGDCSPMSENKECSMYLGVHICENKEFLSKIINIIESMPNNNPGYDAVCIKDKKVNVKCACLGNNNTWVFHIEKNKMTDYFLMIAFNNRENLNVMHIWLVKGDSVIENTSNHWSKEFIFNERDSVGINKGNEALRRWEKYEITDVYKLKEVQKVCNKFKDINKENK